MRKTQQFLIYVITYLVSLGIYIIVLDDVVRYVSESFNMYWRFGDNFVYPLVLFGYFLFPSFCVWISNHILHKTYDLSNNDIRFLFINYFIVMSTLLVKPVSARRYNINFIYLKETLRSALNFSPIDLGNILFFIPLAFFINYKIKKPNFIKCFIVFIAINFTIESLQFIFKLGIFDVNDMVLNTTGFIIGYLLNKLYQLLRIQPQ